MFPGFYYAGMQSTTNLVSAIAVYERTFSYGWKADQPHESIHGGYNIRTYMPIE